MSTDSKNIQQFLRFMAQKLGEPVLEKGLLHIVKSNIRGISNDAWGLGILTESRLMLQVGNSQNWFTSIVVQKVYEEKPLELEIQRSSVKKTDNKQPRGFLSRFLQPFPYCTIQWETAGDVANIIVEKDSASEALIAALP